MILTKFQKTIIVIITVICIAVAVFGILNKQTFNKATADSSNFENAMLYDYSAYADAENDFSENINFEYINEQLKYADTVFVCTVMSSANQYECTKYTVKIDKVIKGNTINNDDEAVLYEYSHFVIDENNELLFFQTITKNLLLQQGKQYLVFAEALEYEKDYQEKLDCREFRIFDAEIDTFCLTDNQEKPLNRYAKTYKEFDNNEYVCFSQKAVDNLNSIKKEIIDAYLKS